MSATRSRRGELLPAEQVISWREVTKQRYNPPCWCDES
jgi:hypothetical protein